MMLVVVGHDSGVKWILGFIKLMVVMYCALCQCDNRMILEFDKEDHIILNV